MNINFNSHRDICCDDAKLETFARLATLFKTFAQKPFIVSGVLSLPIKMNSDIFARWLLKIF